MTSWTAEELNKIGNALELDIASMRADGSLRSPVTIWVVRVQDDLYVRAYKGPGGPWYRGVLSRHAGHIQAGGVDKDVNFIEQPDSAINDQIDAAYHAKYGRFPAQDFDPIVTPLARTASLKLVPR